MSNQVRNNNLNYLIDPTFTNVNRQFVLSFENEKGRTSSSKYYLPKVEKMMSRNNNCTARNLLDYEYF